MNTLIQELYEDFLQMLNRTTALIQRDYTFPAPSEQINVAIGMRRSGKTFFLYQTIHQLLHAGTPESQILYINFEDDRLLPMDHKQMGELLDDFYSLFPENHDKTCYLFLDEVQNVENWHLVVRRYFDTRNVQIYITGSSAKLLSKEIATSLRGRSQTIEIFPYSFIEFLRYRQIPISNKVMGRRTQDHFRHHLAEYFKQGGFPGVQSLPPFAHREMLQNYVETLILRDVIERHQVTNLTLLRYLTSHLLKNVAALFSGNKFFNDIKSQGYKIAKDTVYTYLDYLQDAYLVFAIPLFSASLRRQKFAEKKIYAIDAGLIQANVLNISDNFGKFFENMIFLDLRRQKKEVFYYHTQERYEIDFLTKSLSGEYELIQAVWDVQDKTTLAREERALQAAKKELKIPGRIITLTDYLESIGNI